MGQDQIYSHPFLRTPGRSYGGIGSRRRAAVIGEGVLANPGRAAEISKGLRDVELDRTGRDFGVYTPTPPAPSNEQNDWAWEGPSMLAFPIDVKTDTMQGHYIMFHIKEWSEGGTLTGNKLQRQGRRRRNVSGSGFENVNNYSLMLTNRPHTRLTASIALYMPPQVNASYGIKYADKEVGVVAHGAAEAVNVWRTTSGAGDVAKGIGKLIMPFIETAVKEQGLKVFDAMIPGLSAVEGITSGNVVTPHMELMFEGVGRREFSFSFVMIPKSAKEAKAVDDIVFQFKLGMHPDYTEKTLVSGTEHTNQDADFGVNPGLKTRAMTFPSVFHIEYFYKGAINKHLHKISTCYLTKMDVSHGGDRYAAYAGGVPQKTMITLNFTEMEIMTRQHIKAGY